MHDCHSRVRIYLLYLRHMAIFSGETQVGADSTLLGAGTWLQMEQELAAAGLTLVDVGINLIDQVWSDKPEDIVSVKIVVNILSGCSGCHKGYGEKLSCSQAQPGQAATSAVACFLSISCLAS